jgi:enterochelin esterase-like enzyme
LIRRARRYDEPGPHFGAGVAAAAPVAYAGHAALVPPAATGRPGDSPGTGTCAMRKTVALFVGFLAAGIAAAAIAPALAQRPAATTPDPDSQYRLGPDSLPQPGVPKGQIRGPYTLPSQAYPGTQHTYWVYVPAQYDPAVPAALMVFQDGQAFRDEHGDMRAQNVMDNLTYRREIPVMIGVFINPGRRPDQPEPTPRNWGDRDTNRPTEYNSLDDRYARVITEELMPAVAREYAITTDPEMHGIGGSSSGAIAAFTVAWERPDNFRKVLSNVGSFVNLRGGHVYPEKVLAAEKKPIRVYLCDGRNDNRGLRNGQYDPTRDWFYQNVRLMKALTQKGYDVNYAWGINRHGQKFGGAILPDMMRWLWRDSPVSIDPRDEVERGFRQPAETKSRPTAR